MRFICGSAGGSTTKKMANDGDWTLVLPRRGRRRRRRHNPKTHTPTTGEDQFPRPWTPSSSPSSPTSVAALLEKIHRSIGRLEGSTFHRHFLHQVRHHPGLSSLLHSSPHFVVYGIGSIDAHEPPRLQLALALLLHKELNIPHPIEIFDPVLSALECKVLEKLGCGVMEVDEGGRRAVESPTLFYMPHCKANMYDRLLEVNWSAEGLERVVVLGNSFGEYESYVSGMGKGSRVDGEAKFVVRANKIVEEVRIDRVKEQDGDEVVVLTEDDGDGFFKAFYLTSWHLFRAGDKAEELGLLEKGRNDALLISSSSCC